MHSRDVDLDDSAEHLDLTGDRHGPQPREPALRQRGHGRVALPTEELPTKLRTRDARGATAGIRIAHELARLGEVGDQLAQESERLLRRMAAPMVGRYRMPVDALLAAAVPALPHGSGPARLVGDDEALMAACGPFADELGRGAGFDPHAGAHVLEASGFQICRASRACP
jgi:hypothetical protein